MKREIIIAFLVGAVCVAVMSRGFAQSSSEVRQAFIDLRQDQIRFNCSRATVWLMKNRDALRDQMLNELYRTNDPQERDALLLVLFRSDTFHPDERFARFIVQRLREENSRVSNFFLALPEAERADEEEFLALRGAHHVAWEFIDKNLPLFESLLKMEVSQTTDIWELWAIAWMFKNHNVLSANSHLFTKDVLDRAAAALKNDGVGYNASQAMRLFLMLPKQSTPILRAVANSSDAQQRYFAQAFLDAILRGSQPAVGYLNAKLKLYSGLLPNSDKPEPEWLGQATEPYLEKETYP